MGVSATGSSTTATSGVPCMRPATRRWRCRSWDLTSIGPQRPGLTTFSAGLRRGQCRLDHWPGRPRSVHGWQPAKQSIEVDVERQHWEGRSCRGLDGFAGGPHQSIFRKRHSRRSKLEKQRSTLALREISAWVHGVVLLMPGLCGPGRVPAVRGRAVALRVEPLSKAERLAPDGRPSLTQHGQAGGAGLRHAAALSRAWGSRAPFPSRCA